MGQFYENLKERAIASGIPSDVDKWVHLFDTELEFNDVYNGADYNEPWVSYTEEVSGVNYNKTVLTGISISDLEWVTDVAASGGTATKDNCSYKVLALYSKSERIDVTSSATVQGNLSVPSSMIEQRHAVGTLTLSASYDAFSASNSVDVYQEAFIPTLTAITLDNLTWNTNVPAYGDVATKDNCTYGVTAYYDNGVTSSVTSYAEVTGSLNVPLSRIETVHTAGTLTLTVTYEGLSDSDSVTVYQDAFSYSGSPLMFNIISAGTINWTATNTSHTKTIEYKLNDGGWSAITSDVGTSAPSISVNDGDIVLFRGDNTAYADSSYYNIFSGSTAKFEAEGNIMSLVDSDDFISVTTLSNHAFKELFIDCTGLTSAENLVLPVMVLTDDCYGGMFRGCTSLVNAPELPATTLAISCYSDMFSGCTSLTTAPELQATILANNCYRSMFQGCTSLITAPELPAAILESNCYNNMFYNCTSLNYIKCLATNIIANNCTTNWVYNVASAGTFIKDHDMNDWTLGNTGIPTNWAVKSPYYFVPTTFSIFSAGTINWSHHRTLLDDVGDLAIEYKINDGSWTSITATTGGSSFSVAAGDVVSFRGNNVRYGTLPLSYTTFSGSTAKFEACGNTMSLFDSTGFTTLDNVTEQYALNRLFAGCTGLTTAKHLVLPSTTLPYHVYTSTFEGCSSMVEAPQLPAPVLSNSCYDELFKNCGSLNYIKCLATDISAANCLYNWVNNVSSIGTFVKHANMTGWGNDKPSNWTVDNAYV